MSLPNSIATDAKRLLEDVNELSRWLSELKAFLPIGTEEHARRLYTNARQKIIAMRADVNGIISAVQADGIMGLASAKAWKPEIGEKRRPEQVSNDKLLASLHRAGDHTLDQDDDHALASAATEEGRAVS